MSAGEHPRGASGALRLARLGFGKLDRTGRLLTSPLGLWAEGPVDEDARDVVGALAATADPDLAVLGLARLVERAHDRAELLAALRADPGLRGRVAAVLGASAALGEHLSRHPEDWRRLGDPSDGPLDASEHCRVLLSTVQAAASVPSALDALRRTYRAALLVVAARDLAAGAPIEEVTAELADLAVAGLAASLDVASRELPAAAEPCRLAVIAMGKCGGRELNYVSDVDVVFVAEPVPGGNEVAALRTATTLAAGLMRVASTPTPEGSLWPVDAALRPEGRSGPLVRTLDSHEAYYRRWARTWELQALLKARPVAGDLELGRAYVERLAPLVWTVGERPHFVDDVQEMRRRVESTLAHGQAGRELKLGPGGLRDIEFAVQLLQLVHGRADESVRSGTTLDALTALAAGGYVGREDAAALGTAYRFLRGAEHRLQLQHLRRTHLVPTEPASLRWLARAMGYGVDPERTFEADRARIARETRRLHEKLFYRPLLQAVARLPTQDARLTPEAARARLEALGFADPVGALRHLESLTSGVSRRAAIQQTLLPAMLGWFADAADPDAGLLAFRRVSEALGTTHWYLRVLRDEGATAERLARLLAGSRYVADLLTRAPEAVPLLGRDDDLRPRSRGELEAAMLAVVRRSSDGEAAVDAVRGLRRHELLRIAAADLVGLLDLRAVGTALSDVTEATLVAGLEAAVRGVETELGRPLPVRLAVLAMGRLGGREQGYGSDADVLFVHQSSGGDDGTDDGDAGDAAQAVAEELRRLLAHPAPDPPLHVDADLRPEGRQGSLTRSLASFAAYYDRRAEPWEWQALLRVRPVAGDVELASRFLELVDPLRWPTSGLTASTVSGLRRLKARVESERLPRGADPLTHLKLGPGGLADVEWTVQLLQLCSAASVPELRTTSTLDALDAATEAGLLDPHDAATLETAWRLASRARNAVVLVRGRPADVLPTSGRELAGVARTLGYPPGCRQDAGLSPGGGAALLEDYRRATRRARAVVERVFYT